MSNIVRRKLASFYLKWGQKKGQWPGSTTWGGDLDLARSCRPALPWQVLANRWGGGRRGADLGKQFGTQAWGVNHLLEGGGYTVGSVQVRDGPLVLLRGRLRGVHRPRDMAEGNPRTDGGNRMPPGKN